MRIHILGICGTFMGGLALIARELGHEVSGSDANVYPPMSTQLEEQGIKLMEGYYPSHLTNDIDLIIVGNAMKRGDEIIEHMLNYNLAYMSGPEWLSHFLLNERHVIAVAGTHGKTTTSSMLAWILEYAGLNPGFLIGGVPGNLGISARVGEEPFFVIEADEYDTAFFDKRSKFVHYHPRTAILGNLEFDHADIFDSIDDIKRQFHHLVRIVPGKGMIIRHSPDQNLDDVINMGCWTPVQEFTDGGYCNGSAEYWKYHAIKTDFSEFAVSAPNGKSIIIQWDLIGSFNAANATAAVMAAVNAGVSLSVCSDALAEFVNTRRRLELRGTVGDVSVYDDFAHHPTAIHETLSALRTRVGTEPIYAILELRSNTMRLGSHQKELGRSLMLADEVFILKPQDLSWDLPGALRLLETRAHISDSTDRIIDEICRLCNNGVDHAKQHVLVMSNGAFDNIHNRLLEQLEHAD
ncbi:MAG: UDP-N-acetylmuramate:L-alanyl-gamma-D-glutamyl-meso-diaminopimelate ligase [Gammaproteobacteria bacterium]|nr:MAG: UDP-N-acetylmuramate:L-alanyl-gamma-D-glutamyl-meso-diaminopimelate ligase [Gammaproteobacteria bacterium]